MKYKISGKDRRELKKELSRLNICINRYWIDEDLAEVYGYASPKEQAEQLFKRLKDRRYNIEKMLSETI